MRKQYSAMGIQRSAKINNQHQQPKTFYHRGHREHRRTGEPTTQQRAEALALKLAQTYEELTRLLERNPGVKRQITEGEAKEDKVYQKLKQRLKMADMAPRCQWVKQDGTSCRSPQMKQHIYCFAHMQMAEARDADADATAAGRRQRDPGWADADTEGDD